jgi:hypothetical protein
MAKRPPGEPVEELRRIIEEEEGGEEEVENGLERGLGFPEAVREVLVRVTPMGLGRYTQTQRRYGLDDARHARFINLTWRLLCHRTFRSPLQEDGRPYASVQAFEDLYKREVKSLRGYDHYWQRAYAALSMYFTWVVRVIGLRHRVVLEWPSTRAYGPMARFVEAVQTGAVRSMFTVVKSAASTVPIRETVATTNRSVLDQTLHGLSWFEAARRYEFSLDDYPAIKELLARRREDPPFAELRLDHTDAEYPVRYIETAPQTLREEDGPVRWTSRLTVDPALPNPIHLVGTGDTTKVFSFHGVPVLTATISRVHAIYYDDDIGPDELECTATVMAETIHLDRYLDYMLADGMQVTPPAAEPWPANRATMLMTASMKGSTVDLEPTGPAPRHARHLSYEGLSKSIHACIQAHRGVPPALYKYRLLPYAPWGGPWVISATEATRRRLAQARFTDQAMLLQFASLGYDAFMALPEAAARPVNLSFASMLDLMRDSTSDDDDEQDWLRPLLNEDESGWMYVDFGKKDRACSHVAATPSLATHVQRGEHGTLVFLCQDCMS